MGVHLMCNQITTVQIQESMNRANKIAATIIPYGQNKHLSIESHSIETSCIANFSSDVNNCYSDSQTNSYTIWIHTTNILITHITIYCSSNKGFIQLNWSAANRQNGDLVNVSRQNISFWPNSTTQLWQKWLWPHSLQRVEIACLVY